MWFLLTFIGFLIVSYVYKRCAISNEQGKKAAEAWRDIVLGHRGGAKGCGPKGSAEFIPENSLGAFEYAAAQGANGVELDVWLTKDNVAVVIHDALIDEILEGSGRVGDMNLSDLQTLRYRGLPPATGRKDQPLSPLETIPTLEQALVTLKGLGLRTVIEIKEYHRVKAVCAAVWRLIRQTNCAHTVCVGSFSARVLYQYNCLASGVPTCYIYTPALCRSLVASSTTTLGLLPFYVRNPVLAYLVDSFLCFIARPIVLEFLGICMVSPSYQLVSAQYIESYLSRGIAVTTWVVNSEGMMRYFRELGATPITDYLPLSHGKEPEYRAPPKNPNELQSPKSPKSPKSPDPK